MTMVKEILQQMPAVSKPQAKFLDTSFATILALRGRLNFRNLGYPLKPGHLLPSMA
jgi:hypothetical protein